MWQYDHIIMPFAKMKYQVSSYVSLKKKLYLLGNKVNEKIFAKTGGKINKNTQQSQ